jgi:hypothetical protein
MKGGLWSQRTGQLIGYTLGFHHLRDTLVRYQNALPEDLVLTFQKWEG